MSTGAAPEPLATDIVDVRLLEAMRAPGCPLCAIRARSEKSIMDSIINERVLDLGFRADLERKHGFCRRHVAELVPTDRRETGGILGSSMLLAAIVERRVAGLRETPLARGRKLRDRLTSARKRPPCIACGQGASAVETAVARMTSRARDPGWTAALSDAAFCLDDFLDLWTAARNETSFEPVARRQLDRFEDLRVRLDGFAQHSSQDRRHLMTDSEKAAADEATKLLGGTR
jgi:hypothetical protein